MTNRRASLPGVADIFRPSPPSHTAPPPAAPASPGRKQSETKYTLLLSSEVTLDLLADEAELTRRLGKTPARSALLRALLVLLHEDARLMDCVVDRLRQGAGKGAAPTG